MQAEMTLRAVDLGDGTDGRWTGEAAASLPGARQVIERWVPEPSRVTDDEGAAAVRAALARHMPELPPLLDRLTSPLDHEAAMALWTTSGEFPATAGCTVRTVRGALLRNYDWALDASDRAIVRSAFLRPVIGLREGVLGLLDGMNDAGLAVALTWGGRDVRGPGFGIPLVQRYLLETCATVDQAVAVLRRVPVCTVQNVVLVDRERTAVVHVGPDIEPVVGTEADARTGACAANHQLLPVSDEQERATRTGQRLRAVAAAGDEPDTVVAALLRPPLYGGDFTGGWGTLYTAAYRPAEGRVTYHWPTESWAQSFAAFAPGTRRLTLGTDEAPRAAG
ncbi:C45 family peptidase [Streptomyces avicenniae]|uniref:C45 family peptidase n=1 Tax=Streptomyces avicenniae TaxID=500153 RepID=UPI00069C42FC|nr:C45 family peptidase [Streptomyces avicenniae]